MGMLGNFANFIAYAVMGIPAGLLLQKVGYKKTALIAIAIGFVGVGIQYLSGHAASFLVYLLGAFVAGFSMCTLNTVVNPMLNTLGGAGNKGNQLIQVGGSFNSLCGTLVPILVGILVGEVTKANITDVYPVMYIALGIFALVFIVLSLVNIPEPHLTQSTVSKEKSKHSALSFRHFILGAIAIFVYVGVEVGTPGTANLYMTTFTKEQAQDKINEYNSQKEDISFIESLTINEKNNREETYKTATNVLAGETNPGLGIKTGIAGTIVGLYWLLMLFGRLIGASLGAKISSKTMLAFVSGLGCILVLLAIFIPSSVSIDITNLIGSSTPIIIPISILLLVLCGLCTSVMWGGIFNLAVEGLGKYIAAASGIFMVLVCGGGILPLLQNFIADVAGYMASYWVIFAGLAYLLYYALVGSKNVNKDIPVE
jgi:FHS family L-fucose permease-like MFS transporter